MRHRVSIEESNTPSSIQSLRGGSFGIVLACTLVLARISQGQTGKGDQHAVSRPRKSNSVRPYSRPVRAFIVNVPLPTLSAATLLPSTGPGALPTVFCSLLCRRELLAAVPVHHSARREYCYLAQKRHRLCTSDPSTYRHCICSRPGLSFCCPQHRFLQSLHHSFLQ